MERAAYEVKDERYRLCIETIESSSIYTKFWTMSLFLKNISEEDTEKHHIAYLVFLRLLTILI